ncbi:MAG: hypothetical protein OTI35_15415 [Sulfitobacter sp.]|nr:hypothetical protein [Sulfitobacter sp.]
MKSNLLAKPSKAALGVLAATLVPVTANAQDFGTGITLSFDAGVGSSDMTKQYYDEKLGNEDFDDTDFDNDSAFIGSVALSGALINAWDWKISVSRAQYSENSATLSDYFEEDGNLDLDTVNTRTEVGASVGRSFELGAVNARIGLGLAYANATTTAEKGFPDDFGGPGDREMELEFRGLGGRISLDAESMPLTADGRLSAIGGAEANLYSGEYALKATTGEDGLRRGPIQEFDGDFTTAGIYVGLKYALNDTTAVRFGLRQDIATMEMPNPENEEIDNNDERSSMSSAFIGIDIKF